MTTSKIGTFSFEKFTALSRDKIIFIIAGIALLSCVFFFLPKRSAITPPPLPALEERSRAYIAFRVANDYVKYLEMDVVSPRILPFLNFRELFIPTQDITLTKIIPFQDADIAYRHAPFFGARILYVPDLFKNSSFNILATSIPYEKDCLQDKISCFARAITEQGLVSQKKLIVNKDRFSVKIRGITSRDHLGGWFGLNSRDINGDGLTDFIMERKLILSSPEYMISKRIDVAEGIPVNYGAIFLTAKDPQKGSIKTFLAGLLTDSPNSFGIMTIDQKNTIRTVRTVSVGNELGGISGATPYPLYPFPDIDGDKADEIIVVQQRGISFMLSSPDFGAQNSFLISFPIEMNRYSKSRIRIGGIGDFTGDGLPDFWISLRSYKGGGSAWLIDTSEMLKSAAKRSLEDLKVFELRGSEDLGTNHDEEADGIGSSVSYHAGDIDGDHLPDFTIASHYNLSYSGSLFILTGKQLQKFLEKGVRESDVLHCDIIRLRAPLASELAPPFFHYDNVDFNRDGLDDILIAADNDSESGAQAGAIYILDSAAIKKQVEKYRAACVAFTRKF